MLNVIDANPVGRYRVEDASPTDGVGAGTAGKVAGTPGMDAHAVGRCRVEDARLIDSDGEAGRKLTC